MKRYVGKKIQESGLSRVYKHMAKHDTGLISAFRSEFSNKENKQKNKKLYHQLSGMGYGITEVNGIFIENYNTPDAVEVKEQTFFVVDLNDRGNLEKMLRKLGEGDTSDSEHIPQDSIIFIPKGGDISYLWGTSKNNNYPKYGTFMSFPIRSFGKDDNPFLTKVYGRPFYFKESSLKNIKKISYCGNNGSKYISSLMGEKHWREQRL